MTDQNPRDRRARLISFSGIDGAGKSTQIAMLLERLNQAGFRVSLLAFWDDVSALTSVREFSGHALFKGEKGVGSPTRPVNRRDKNVQSWYMTAVRFVLYLLDAVSLRLVAAKQRRAGADVIIFDRYLYDELVNLNLTDRIARIYVRWLLTMIPQPDIAYLLDADPAEARERKPEYPVDFLHQNRAAYFALSEMAGGMTLIAPQPVEEAAQQVLEEMLRKSPFDLQRFSITPQGVASSPKSG